MNAILAVLAFCLLWQEALLQQNPYCVQNPNHSMCVLPVKGSTCGTSYVQWKPSTTDIDLILKWHNDYRSRTASGLENKTNNGTKTMPKACNMRKLSWDNETATIAQRLADQCVMNHDCNTCRDVLNKRISACGQNIAQSWTTSTAISSFTSVFDGWYSKEVNLFDVNYVPKYVFGKWGHYSQVIWGDTWLIGCGGARFKTPDNYNSQIVVCNYGIAGNWGNSAVYKIGEPCSCCPANTTCSGSLCV